MLSKNASKVGNFWEMQAFGKEFFAFVRLYAYDKFAFMIYASQTNVDLVDLGIRARRPRLSTPGGLMVFALASELGGTAEVICG